MSVVLFYISCPNLFLFLQRCHQVGIVINYILRGVRCRNLSHMLRVAPQVSCRADNVTCVDLEEGSPALVLHALPSNSVHHFSS